MATQRRWLWATLGAVLLLGSGCDLGSLVYFLMPEGMEKPRIKQLAADDVKKPTRAAILTYTMLETRPECIQADRQLAELLAATLRADAEEKKEGIVLLPQRKVEAYKNDHPGWRQMDPGEMGRALRVDHVIYLEINTLSLYEPHSARAFYRGRIQGTVTLFDVKTPDETPEKRHFSYVYPSDARGGIIDANFDNNVEQFRDGFLRYVAQRLSLNFISYRKRVGAFVDVEEP
jgi:hypothetical protein